MTTGDLRPAFVTAEECRQWLMTTPLSNAVQALAHMLRQLNLLNRTQLPAGERMAILEMLRKRLTQAQEEGAKRFIGKPLPLVPPEQAAFDSAQAVWQALLKGYGHCIEAEMAQPAGGPSMLAQPFQRAFATLVAIQIDTYRAGFEPAPSHWQMLHRLYVSAEQAGIADTEVDDALRQGKTPSTARAAYVEALLLQMVSPHELSARHLAWILRWTLRWSQKIRILASAPALDNETVPLHVDLSSSQPAGYQPVVGQLARWLDTNEVRRSIKKRMSLLEKGTPPAELQLGEDCTQPACGQVLRHVYQRWCRGGFSRKHERTTTDSTCAVIAGVENIYFNLAGRQFRQPGHSDDDTLRRERDEMATFGRVAPLNIAAAAQTPAYRREEWKVVENWHLLDESATGIHVAHPIKDGLERVNQRQLVAVQPPSANAFLIGILRWAMVGTDAQLHAGIILLPGRPEPVAIRPVEMSGVRETFKPGFLLPEVSSVNSTTSIITGPGIFRAGRVLELVGGLVGKVRLTHLVDRGIDFDRVGFEPIR
jgi:cyclic-di-GMP-binding protein